MELLAAILDGAGLEDPDPRGTKIITACGSPFRQASKGGRLARGLLLQNR